MPSKKRIPKSKTPPKIYGGGVIRPLGASPPSDGSVGVGDGSSSGVGLEVGAGVIVCVGVGVFPGVGLEVGNGVLVWVGVTVRVAVAVDVGVGVDVGAGVLVFVGVIVCVGVGVSSGVGLAVGTGVHVRFSVGVGEGTGVSSQSIPDKSPGVVTVSLDCAATEGAATLSIAIITANTASTTVNLFIITSLFWFLDIVKVLSDTHNTY